MSPRYGTGHQAKTLLDAIHKKYAKPEGLRERISQKKGVQLGEAFSDASDLRHLPFRGHRHAFHMRLDY